MPLYEYKCGACGHRFERIVKFSDPPVTSCPQCGKDSVERVITAPAVQFKGSGWYVSDYARKKSPAAASEGGEKVSAAKEGSVKEASSAPQSSASSEKTAGSGSGAANESPSGSVPKPDAGKSK